MKKRIFSALLVFVLLLGILPAEAFAEGMYSDDSRSGKQSYGSNLGWEYALVTDNGRGYNLKDPAGTDSYYGSHVTVTLDGEPVAEGYSNRKNSVLSSTSTSIVNVSADYGYYIRWIVFACGDTSDKNPFHCQTVQGDNAFSYALPSSTPTSVNINITDLYSHANHASGASNYFLMIELALMPTDIHVGYDSGSINGVSLSARPVSESGTLFDGATQVSSFPTWHYDTQGLTAPPVHSTLSVSPEAEAQANALGYSFAGWSLSYYTQYSESDNAFNGTMTIGGSNLSAGTNVSLSLNAKLTAIWQPLTTVSVSKVWDDADNRDGIRPSSVLVYLKSGSSQTVGSVTLDESNNWNADFTVPMYNHNGVPIRYCVEESVPDGYTSYIVGDFENGFTICNVHSPEKTSITVMKVWDDDNDRDGLRPEGVVVALYKNGSSAFAADENACNAVLNASNNWCYTWSDLDKYEQSSVGIENNYTVVEIGFVDAGGERMDVSDYDVSYGNENGILIIRNFHSVETRNIPVTKVWDDEDDRDGIRPDSVTVTLYANGISTQKTLMLNSANNWSGVFENVSVNDSGTPITYSIVESEVPDYSVTVFANANGGFTVTNTHNIETTDLCINKVWNDNNDQDGIRPDFITVMLYADGVDTGKTAILNAKNLWTASFTDLAVYRRGAHGESIRYTIREKEQISGYTSEVDGTTIINTHTPETASLRVRKVWEDAENRDGLRPDSVTLALLANASPTGLTLTLDGSESTPWTGVFENLPVYHDGVRISYTVSEISYTRDGNSLSGVPQGYHVRYSFDGSIYTVINHHAPEETSLNVRKEWLDDNNRDGLRPDFVTVTLMKQTSDGNATSTGMSATLSEENNWSASFTGLAKNENGVALSYFIEESDVPGYTTAYQFSDETQSVVIQNSHTSSTVSIDISKIWDDCDNRDGIRPDSVTVTLYANGVACGESMELSESNGWHYTRNDCFAYENGNPIEYTVSETNIPDGYCASVEGNVKSGFIVTNAHTAATICIPVQKIWNDNENQDGIRPKSVIVTLCADGTPTEKTLTLSPENAWRGTFENLDANRSGTPIDYTIVESVPSGYESAITGTMSEGFTVTNTHIPEEITFEISKSWDDDFNRDGIRPERVMITLLANGKAIRAAEMCRESAWIAVFPSLPVYENGVAIRYTLAESDMEGYTPTFTYGEEIDGTAFVTLTNTHIPETISFTAVKVWDDFNDQDGIRPGAITVQLLADGAPMGDAVSLTAAGGWSYTWEALNRYRNGAEIVYSVVETEVSGYETSYTTQEDLFTIQNTHAPETVCVRVEKNWMDDENRDALRPESLDFILVIDGVDSESILTLNEDNHWSGVWDALPKYRDHGIEIIYTVREANVPNGYKSEIVETEDHCFTITNTHICATTEISVTKLWEDEEDNDGKRPDGIIVQLLANASPMEGAQIILTAENNWQYTWQGIGSEPLYLFSEGEEIVYSVDEVGYIIDGKQFDGLPEGYTKEFFGESYELRITNTRPTEKIAVTVQKIWDDANDQDGIRPNSVDITLYRNGDALETVTLSREKGWSFTFESLYRFIGGSPAEYTVKESSVDGYHASYGCNVTQNGAMLLTVTNTHIPETVDYTLQKVWVDHNDASGYRTAQVTVQLYKNGAPYGDPIVLSNVCDWKQPLTLDKYENGKLIEWTIKEKDIPEYYHASYDQKTLTVTNTIVLKDIPQTGDAGLSHLWYFTMAVSAGGLVTISLYYRKKERKHTA